MRNRPIFLKIVILCGTSSALAGCSLIPHPQPPAGPPTTLSTPGVILGGTLLKRSGFTQAKVGTVTDMAVNPRTHLITFSGTTGAASASSSGAIKSLVNFDSKAERTALIPLKNGKYEYLNRGSWSSDASLFGPNGVTLWTVPKGQGVNDAVAGDIAGDGKSEFVVGYNGSSGISLLNSEGEQIWNRPEGNVWQVETIGPDKQGQYKIVHSDAAGKLTIRAGNGDIVSTNKPSFYFSSFSICRWPTRSGSPCIVTTGNKSIWILSPTGQVLMRRDAPETADLEIAHATLVRITPGKPAYLAVVCSPMQTYWNRSMLYLYDPAGKLVYQEMLPTSSTALAVIPAPSSQRETLLVGGTDQIWKYR